MSSLKGKGLEYKENSNQLSDKERFDYDLNGANILYFGQYKDEFTGLYYNYHRDYSHRLKRYLQIDPLGLYDGTNPYIYVKNNSLNYFDFYGLCSCDTGINAANLTVKEMIERQDSWATDNPMPKEYTEGDLYQGIFQGLKPGKKDDGRLEGGNKCIALIYSTYIKSGLEIPIRRINSIYGTYDFFHLQDDVKDYFDKIDISDVKRGDLIVAWGGRKFGSSGHIGIVLDPVTRTTISANTHVGVRMRDDSYYTKSESEYYNENKNNLDVDIKYSDYEVKDISNDEILKIHPPVFLRYKCKCNK